MISNNLLHSEKRLDRFERLEQFETCPEV